MRADTTSQQNSDRICLVISSLGSGGAERVMSALANYWSRNGRVVTLITLSDAATDFYRLDDGVVRVGLDMMGASRGALHGAWETIRRVKALRRAIVNSDCERVISFMDSTNVLVLLACKGLDKTVVVSERIDPRHYPIGKGWDWLRRRTYPKAHALVVQTSAVAQWARKVVSAARVHVIPNPVEPAVLSDAAPVFDGPFVLAVGRLDRQKGFDLLVSAWHQFRQTSNDGAGWKVVIAGEGPERETLEAQILHAGLKDEVMLIGRREDLSEWYNNASLFVLCSRFEGFPNALLEAMAAGLPVIATDCPSGPGEIIEHTRTGWLIEPDDVRELVQAFLTFFRAPMQHSQVGLAAQEAVKVYSIENVAAQWDALFSTP